MEKLRELALCDFRFCVEKIFLPDWKFAEFHFRWVEFMDGGSRNLLLAYPGSAKTTIAHLCRHAHALLQNWWEIKNGRATRPLITLSGSQNMPKAREMASGIKSLLLAPMVVWLFGQVVLPGPYTSDESFDLFFGKNVVFPGKKDRSVQAFGVDAGQIIAKHASKVTLDDPVTWKNSRTAVQRENLWSKIHTDIVRGLDPGAELNICGTRHHDGDAYGALKRLNSFAGRCIEQPMLSADDVSTWPERWSTQECLDRRADTPPFIWRALYQEDTKFSEGGLIRLSRLSQGFFSKAETPPLPNLSIYIGGDLAVKQKEHNDYSAFAVMGVDTNRHEWELEIIYGKWTFEECATKLEQIGNAYREQLRWINLDEAAGGFQVAAILRKRCNLPIMTTNMASRKKMGKDKTTRVELYSPMVEQGKVHLIAPEERDDYMPGVGTFIDEGLAFRKDVAPPPPLHDDRWDAWLLAHYASESAQTGYFEYLRQEASRLEEKNRLKDFIDA
jgi:predicted phage terminase large subunit-like protein